MTPVKAADLGGNCCADLEERVAELEATTVRKGNRKMSVTLSGFVAHNVMWWDDGKQQDMYIGDGGNYFSRFRFVGSAKISPTVTAGFLYEFGVNQNAISSMNQLNGGDDLGGASAPLIRDTTVWLQHSQLGKLKVGHGSTSTDNLVLIDLGGMAGAGTPDIALYIGGFLLRGSGAGANMGLASQNWGNAIRGHESWDTSRRNHILYETPTIAGFTLQAAVAEDNYWDVALRYAGEFGGFRVAFGIGYQEDSEFNSPSQGGFGGPSPTCTARCDAKTQEVKGSASILHVPTGLFLTGAAGNREIDGGVVSPYNGPDLQFWYLSGGIRKNFFGIGDSVLFGEYGEHKGGLAQATYFDATVGHPSDSKVVNWGIGWNQYIDAAAMEVFLTYKHFEVDSAPDYIPLTDFSAVIAGARVNF
jgi:hypothetical protein